MVVPLNTWVLISNFKLAYNLLRRPDGTFNRHLAEFLDRKVPANANAVDGVFSFDVIIDRGTSLLSRIYRQADAQESQPNIVDLEKPISLDVVPALHLKNRHPCAYDDGWTALKDRDWYWRAFLPEGEDRDHPACNPFGPKGKSLEGMKFPKSLVVVAGLDLVQDWQLAYAEGLKKVGQDVKLLYLEQATIGFYLLPNNNHFHTVMNEISEFFFEALVAVGGCLTQFRRPTTFKVRFWSSNQKQSGQHVNNV
ncbi:GID1a [Populus alba x Populus x berolinensis]|nr:GID1a [Populus alba x Populus x berolinensis]